MSLAFDRYTNPCNQCPCNNPCNQCTTCSVTRCPPPPPPCNICPPPCEPPCKEEVCCEKKKNIAQFTTFNKSINNIILNHGDELLFHTTTINMGHKIEINKGSIILKKGIYNVFFSGNVSSVGQISFVVDANIVSTSFTNNSQLSLNQIIVVSSSKSKLSLINTLDTNTTFITLGPNGIIACPYIIITKL